MKHTLFLISIVGLILLSDCQQIRPPRQDQSRCSTPDGDSGDCLNIRQCPRLLELLRNSRNKPEVVDFLRRSMCGFDNNDPRVCCPSTQSDEPRPNTNEPITKPRNPDDDEYPNIPSAPDCGHSDVSHTRIIGGSPSDLGAWPWIAALGYRSPRTPRAKLQWLCGAALVTNRHIITAAHCTRHPSLALIAARLGDLDLNDSVRDGASPVEVGIRRALAHPQYSATKYTNDIAILYLEDTVQFNKLIQPICLPKSADHRSRSFEKTTPFVAGWGSLSFKGPSSTRLQEIQIPVTDHNECRKAYGPLGGEITLRQMCAGKGGKDACQGDSGGPLMWPKSAVYYLIGVVSYGFRCAEEGYPGIYTRTTAYLDWINKNLV